MNLTLITLLIAFAPQAPQPQKATKPLPEDDAKHIVWKFPPVIHNAKCQCDIYDAFADGKHVAKMEGYPNGDTHLLLDKFSGKEEDVFTGKDSLSQAYRSLFRQVRYGDKPIAANHHVIRK